MRKAMQLEQTKDERTAENAALRAKNEELEAKIVDTHKREDDYRTQKEHSDETAFLSRQITQLKVK
jgi:cell division protein FtsB